MCLLKPGDCDFISLRLLGGDFAFRNRGSGVDLGPISRRLLKATLARRVVFGNFSILRVIRFRRTQKGLERYQGGLEGENWGPGILQNIEANGTGSRGDVGMVHLRDELHLDWLERIRFRDHNILHRTVHNTIGDRKKEGSLTTSKVPPSYGVSFGPGNDPLR